MKISLKPLIFASARSTTSGGHRWLVTCPSGRSASFTAFHDRGWAPPVARFARPWRRASRFWWAFHVRAYDVGISRMGRGQSAILAFKELAAIVRRDSARRARRRSLDDAAARLLVHQLRVDDAAESSTHHIFRSFTKPVSASTSREQP